MKYFDALKGTMEWLGLQQDTVFIGQTVAGPGTFMYPTLEEVSLDKRLEMPICESFQMQFCLGVALTGKTVIAVYPRQNFLMLATADMVNMVDKVVDLTHGEVNPHLIIRVATGPDHPIHPGIQHVNNYAEAFRKLFKNIPVIELGSAGEVLPQYQAAYNRKGPSLIIEHGNLYNA